MVTVVQDSNVPRGHGTQVRVAPSNFCTGAIFNRLATLTKALAIASSRTAMPTSPRGKIVDAALYWARTSTSTMRIYNNCTLRLISWSPHEIVYIASYTATNMLLSHSTFKTGALQENTFLGVLLIKTNMVWSSPNCTKDCLRFLLGGMHFAV